MLTRKLNLDYLLQERVFYGHSYCFLKPPKLVSLNSLGESFEYLSLKSRKQVFRDSLKSHSLGLKIFIHNNELFIDAGYSHFCLLKLPQGLNAICRKKKVYLETEIQEVRDVLSSFQRIKKFSKYKSKGLMFSSRIKYMRLRVGKKQQI